MGYVKMPEMLSPEIVKALAGNVYTVKDEPSPKDEMAAAWKEYIKEDKKCEKKEEKKCSPKPHEEEINICCVKKVKFIFVLNNAAIINVNAIAEEDSYPA